MDRSLLGLSEGNDAYYITGFPIQTTPSPLNGQVLAYENGVVDWITTIPGDIATISNIGSGQGLFAGISGGDNAQFYSLSSANSNIAVSLSGSTVDVNLNNTLALTNLTTTGNLIVSGALEDFTNSTGTNGKVLTSTGTQVFWEEPPVISAGNNGSGAQVLKGVLSGIIQLRTFNGDSNISVVASGDDIYTSLNSTITLANINSTSSLTSNGTLSVIGTLTDNVGSPGTNNQYLASDSGIAVVWKTLPTAVGSIANLASQGFYQGTSGGVANFYGLDNTDGNVVISQSGNNVHANLNTSIVVPTITASAILSISNGLRDHTGTTGSAGQNLSSTGSGAQTLWTTPLLSLDADTLISSPTAGDSLIFSGVSGKWQNTPAGASVNIYNTDGTLTGNRNLYLNSHSLTFDGPGSILIPSAMAAQYAELGTIVADGTGKLALYPNGWDWTSINTTISTTGFNLPTLNCINFCTFTHPGNADFIGDAYLTVDGYGAATALQWKIVANGAGSSTGWNSFQQVIGNLSNPNSGQATFSLQGRIGSIAYNVLEIRLIQNGGSGVSADGNLRILMRGQDNTFITSALSSQTPYLDSVNTDYQLQNVYTSKVYNFIGSDITTMGSQNFYYIPCQKLWLSASICFYFGTFFSAQTIAFNFYLNGHLNSYALSNSYTVATDGTLTISNFDLVAGSLYQSGVLVSGTNALTIGITSSGGVITTAAKSYSVSIIAAF